MQQLPADKVLRVGQKYDIPFQFLLPEQLPEKACRPDHGSEKLHHLHLSLPASVGNRTQAGLGKFLNRQPDMASPFSCIHYQVHVLMTKDPKSGGSIRPSVGDCKRKVKVIPASEEHAPLTVDSNDEEYRMRDEMSLHETIFKTGRIAVEAAQPRALRLPAPNAADADEHRVTTNMEVMLRFDPKKESQRAPKLTSAKTQIRVMNFVSAGARKNFPTKGQMRTSPYKLTLWDEEYALSNRKLDNVCWQRHDPGTADPDGLVLHQTMSSTTTSRSPAPTKRAKPNLPFYTARLLVPIALPDKKSKEWLPTFHSAMFSRVYILETKIDTEWCRLTAPVLKIPVEIISSRTENQPQIDPQRMRTDPIAHWLRLEPVADVPPRLDAIDHAALAANTTLPSYSIARAQPPYLPAGGIDSSGAEPYSPGGSSYLPLQVADPEDCEQQLPEQLSAQDRDTLLREHLEVRTREAESPLASPVAPISQSSQPAQTSEPPPAYQGFEYSSLSSSLVH